MIFRVAKIGVCVGEQQRAVEFYTKILGFELVADRPMGPGARWIEVLPPGGGTSLALWTPPGMEDRIGTSSGIVFKCDDVQRTHQELRVRGVAFVQEPIDQPGGLMGTFTDQDGNLFVLRG